jgi:hypothetical protein
VLQGLKADMVMVLSGLVIVACMKKLLSLLNAMVRDGLACDQLDIVKKLAPAH